LENSNLSSAAHFILQNKVNGTLWSDSGPTLSNPQLFSLFDAENKLYQMPEPYLWSVKKAVFYGIEEGESKKRFVAPEPLADYTPPDGTIASEFSFKPNDHILIAGEVQIGKLYEKQELILLLMERYKMPVLLFFRNNNADYHQFMKRLREFNDKKRLEKLPVLPEPIDILTKKNELPELFKDKNLIVGLANAETIRLLDSSLKNSPESQGKLCVILDEADLVTFELEQDAQLTQTETAFKSAFENLLLLISVTGTSAPILMCDKIDYLYSIERDSVRRNGVEYFGIDRVTHIPIEPLRVGKKNCVYNPYLDEDNLRRIFSDTHELDKSTLLVSVTRLTREHKDVVAFCMAEFGSLYPEDIYMELNEKTVKVYKYKPGFSSIADCKINEISGVIGKGKVAAIDLALEIYKHVPHITILAGVLAGRGVSFVSSKYERHLSHQYIADADSSNLCSAIQSVRLLGKYKSDTKLILYCSEVLYRDLKNQNLDLKKFIEAGKKALQRGERLPDILGPLQREYARSWLPPRIKKGVVYRTSASPAYTIKVLDDPTGFQVDAILTNLAPDHDFAASLINEAKPSGNESGQGSANRLVYCNPMSDFTPVGMLDYVRKHNSRSAKGIKKLVDDGEDFPHLESVKALYQKFPQWEGKYLLFTPVNQQHFFVKK
jgi:hypothetical protein